MEERRINKLHGILIEDNRVPELQEKVDKLIDGGGTSETDSIVILKPGDVLNQALVNKLSKASQIYYSQEIDSEEGILDYTFPVTLETMSAENQVGLLHLNITLSNIEISNIHFTGIIPLFAIPSDEFILDALLITEDGKIYLQEGVTSGIIAPIYVYLDEENTQILQQDIDILRFASSVYISSLQCFAHVGKANNSMIELYVTTGNEIKYITLQTGKTFSTAISNAVVYTLTTH